MSKIKNIAAYLFILPVAVGCGTKNTEKNLLQKYKQIVVEETNTTPTVDIKNFVLVSSNVDAELNDAKEIMRVKRNFPLAMQLKSKSLFDSILAQNFIFRAEDEFYNRADYIQDRTTCTDTVTAVKYENLVLQFFGEVGVLTYRNIVDNKGILNDTIVMHQDWIEYMSWADIYIKEDGKWKIGSVHQIEYRTSE